MESQNNSFFEREEAFVSAFILELSCKLNSDGEGRAVLAPFLAESHGQPFSQVAFLCTDGMREMGQ